MPQSVDYHFLKTAINFKDSGRRVNIALVEFGMESSTSADPNSTWKAFKTELECVPYFNAPPGSHCSLLVASQHYEHELQILQRQMVGQLTLAKDLNDLELRRARQEELLRIRQEELSLSRQYPWNECIAAHTLPLPYVSPLPSPLLLTSWVCLSRLSHERRLMISSDPRSILANCARRWPARQPLRPRQKAADSGTGEGGESTDEASTAARGSRREHGLGRHAAADASAGKGMRGWAHAQPRNAGKGMRGWAHAQPRNVIVSAVCVSDCAVAPCSPPGVGCCARAAHIAQRQLRYSHGTAVPTRHYRELFITKNSSLRISLK